MVFCGDGKIIPVIQKPRTTPMLLNRFETILADTDKARALHYQLRYKVFCEETGFEHAERFPDGQERDEYDDFAAHFLVWDRMDREWAGAMRLVDASRTPLPSERICASPLKGLEARRSRTVEFSRLCILPKYRSTPSADRFGMYRPLAAPGAAQIPVVFRQTDNEILLRLIRATYGWGHRSNARYCYGIITPALARILSRFGIPLKVVGERVKHRGIRVPHRYNMLVAERRMIERSAQFARIVRTSKSFIPYSELASEQKASERRANRPSPVTSFHFDTVESQFGNSRFSFEDSKIADSTFV
jgi:N-acyl amino acid synthase of PEP-CTERM/exosortase system